MRRIGIRELRQNASQYIRLVKAGETIEVTERGVPVAELKPISKNGTRKSRLDELVEQGLATRPTRDLREFRPLKPILGEKPLSHILQELRDDERY